MTATQAGATVPAHSVDFVDENDAGGVFLGLDKQVADPGGPHAHEHLHEIRATDAEEGYSRFAGDGPGQECFAAAGGTHQKDALGDTAPQAGELFRVFEEFD